MGLHENEKLAQPVIRTNEQFTEWKKIFASHTSDKGIISRDYKELLKLNSKEINCQSANGLTNLIDNFQNRNVNGH